MQNKIIKNENLIDQDSLVSVIIPVHNGEKYLSDTIESVINQSYENWELILIDDGSTDKTSSIIDKFVIKEKRIKKISLDFSSGGPATPRNKGILEAKGKFISFLDADDIWKKEKLKTQVEFIYKEDADMVCCGATVINSNSNVVGLLNSFLRFRIINIFFSPSFCLMIFNPVVLSSSLLKKSSSIKFRQECQFQSIEDWLCWIDMTLKGKTIKVMNDNLLMYRDHKSSISAINGEKQYLKGFFLYSTLLLEQKIGLGKYFFVSFLHLIRTLKARVFN